MGFFDMQVIFEYVAVQPFVCQPFVFGQLFTYDHCGFTTSLLSSVNAANQVSCEFCRYLSSVDPLRHTALQVKSVKTTWQLCSAL